MNLFPLKSHHHHTLFKSTLIITSLLFSINSLANELIVKDAKLAKDLMINYHKGKAYIDIESSDIRGISHNYYTYFNVDKNGVVFNNPENSGVTLIINEVTSINKTRLAGDLSIDGKSANIIIANPNGINCDDCSFSGVEKITLINGRSDNLNIGKYKISNQGSIQFNTNGMHQFVFNKINIISTDVKFNKDVIFSSDELNIINGKQNYHLFNSIQSKFHKGKLFFDSGSIINTNKFTYYAGNNNFINQGVINIGNAIIETKGKLINYGSINLLSGRIYRLLENLPIEYPMYDFSNRVSQIKAKSFRNENSGRFTTYNTNTELDLAKGNFTNKGYVSLSHSHLSTQLRNFFHKPKGLIFTNQSSVTIESENKIRLEGMINTLNSKYPIYINKGKIIYSNDDNKKFILIKK